MKHNPQSLASLAASPDPVARLRALRLMRCQIEAGQPPGDYLQLARMLIADPDHDCRWQAMHVVSRSTATNPEAVWQIVRECGESPDEDLRDAVATILLEELLNHPADDYAARLRQCIAGGSAMLADTVWRYGHVAGVSDADATRSSAGLRLP